MLRASGFTNATIATALRIPAGRDVIGDTGLAGRWHVTLTFALPGDHDASEPSCFAAVQEQLELRLEPSTAPVEVIVVETMRQPTPN